MIEKAFTGFVALRGDRESTDRRLSNVRPCAGTFATSFATKCTGVPVHASQYTAAPLDSMNRCSSTVRASAQAAAALNISERAVAALRNNNSLPSDETFAKLSQALKS